MRDILRGGGIGLESSDNPGTYERSQETLVRFKGCSYKEV